MHNADAVPRQIQHSEIGESVQPLDQPDVVGVLKEVVVYIRKEVVEKLEKR